MKELMDSIWAPVVVVVIYITIKNRNHKQRDQSPLKGAYNLKKFKPFPVGFVAARGSSVLKRTETLNGEWLNELSSYHTSVLLTARGLIAPLSCIFRE